MSPCSNVSVRGNIADVRKRLLVRPRIAELPVPLDFISLYIRVWSFLLLRTKCINPLNPELNPICYFLALLAHHFLHVSRIRVKSLTLRLLMSYIYIYICVCVYIYIYNETPWP